MVYLCMLLLCCICVCVDILFSSLIIVLTCTKNLSLSDLYMNLLNNSIMITQFVWMYYVLASSLYSFYSLFSFLVMFYSYYIDVQLSHLNKDYLLT